MLYNKLSILPMVLFAEINETGEFRLLDTEQREEEKDFELLDLWESLKSEYDKKYGNNAGKKNFNLIKEIDFVGKKYVIIKMCAEALKFDVNQIVLEILAEYAYKVDVSNLHSEIKRISEESENILLKLTELKNKLPKPEEGDGSSARENVLKSLSAYSMVLGFDIDYYTVSVEKYFLLNKSATEKIKQPNYGK